jgi:hypothetical protein
MLEPVDLASFLQEDFERQAEWRREKAKEYPDDRRNIEAANLLDHLALTANAVPSDVLKVAGEFFVDNDAVENWHELLRQIGFSSAPSNAEEFVRDFIAEQLR